MSIFDITNINSRERVECFYRAPKVATIGICRGFCGVFPYFLILLIQLCLGSDLSGSVFAFLRQTTLERTLSKMKELEERIIKDGVVLSKDILKVNTFFNQQLDTRLVMDAGHEIARLFESEKITKILTIEASGIAIATAAAVYLGVPVVFAKKHQASTQVGQMLTAEIKSMTHGNSYTAVVPASLISKEDRILIVDDFLARGEALRGLITIVSSAEAHLCGCAVGIEKRFQGGGDELRAKGIRVESLASIEKMSPDEGIVFSH